jgi:hypothetical protein
VKAVEGSGKTRIYVTSALRQRTCCQVLEKRTVELRLDFPGGRKKRQQNFVRRCELKTSLWCPLLDFKEMACQCVEWGFLGSV